MKDLPFLKLLVVLNGLVPLGMLAWDAAHGQLGSNAVNNALHITGILSLVFLVLSLVITPLRWWTGWGGWVAFRRALGLYGFFYAVVHLGIYIAFDRAMSLSSTLDEIWKRRFLQVGTVALILMIPLAVTSTNRMIQRLTPRRWKLLHRLAYLVAALGVLHFYMLVKSDVRQPIAFGVVVAALLVARFVKHYLELRQRANTGAGRLAKPSSAHSVRSSDALALTTGTPAGRWNGELRVAEIIRETPDVKTFRLAAVDGGAFPFAYHAGQFLNIQLPINGRRVNRSYTIASSPTRSGYCELTIKREPQGLASRYMHDELKLGDTIKASGPAGKFLFAGEESPAVLLIAGGVGITPVMSIARSLTDRAWAGRVYFLAIAKTAEDLIFRSELESLAARFPQFKLCMTLTRETEGSAWTGERGRPTPELLRRFVPDIDKLPVFLCGPNEMMDATRELLWTLGVPDDRIVTEAFAAKKNEMPSDQSSRSSPVLTVNGQVHGSCAIRFARSGQQVHCDAETTILEAAESVEVPVSYECRSGICGQCTIRLLEGTVQMDRDDALSATQKASGLILACQARARTAVAVDL